MDKKQVLIVAQNAMAHAVNIVTHNSGGNKVKLDTIIACAEIITQHMLDIAEDKGEDKKPYNNWKKK